MVSENSRAKVEWKYASNGIWWKLRRGRIKVSRWKQVRLDEG